MTAIPTVEPINDPSSATAPAQRRPSGLFSLRPLWILYVLSLRQYLHGKRWMVMGFLFLLPAGLAILDRALERNVPSITLEFFLAFWFIPQAILPLVALLYASGMIQDELEEQTITYLLIRPISRWALYTVKLLATLTTTVLLTAVFTVLLYAAIYAGAETSVQNIPLRCLKAASIHGLAVVAYCCLFGVLSLLTKRSLVVGIIYSAVFEGLLANLPFGIRLITIIYYTRLIAYRTLEFVDPLPNGLQDMAAVTWQFDVQHDPGLAEHPQIRTCLIVLLVGSVVCTMLSALLCSQREFHVKTPEKS